VIELRKDICVQTRSKRFKLAGGRYIYCGSARRNIYARIKRHLGAVKNKFWHVDFLLASGGVVEEVWVFDEAIECGIAHECLSAGAMPVSGFGSSDCARCPAHLFAIFDMDSNNLFSRCAQLEKASGS